LRQRHDLESDHQLCQHMGVRIWLQTY
jgi:hypothetical protein